jgi:hypothetical protein
MSSSASNGFSIRAFDLEIRIECDSAEMRDSLDRFLLPPLPRSGNSAEAVDVSIRIEEKSDCFRILLNEEAISSALTINETALATVKALDDALVRRLKGLRAVHAGAVVLEGRALLIPGGTHAGKSSLVAELLRRGAAHLSDEYALVDGEGRVHAYPRPLLLRNSGPKQSLVLPRDLEASFQLHPVPVGWILAVDYVPNAAWTIHEVSQGEAVLLLLRNTPHEMSQSPEMIEYFQRSAANAECYVGIRGEAAGAADRIFDLIHRK